MTRANHFPTSGREPDQAGVARIGQHEPYSSGISGGGSSAMMKKNKGR
jgi:hypothetical protein